MLPIILLGLGIFFLFRFLKRNRENNSANTYNQGYEQQNTPFENNQGNQIIVNSIVIAESEKQKFADILIEIQTAWSLQDSERMKKFVTPEIAKYFFDALSQNLSQNLANKVEDVRVLSVEISESWQEEDLEYATAILEWSCIDYTINTEKAENDSSFVTEGDRNNPVKTSEAWTFVRYGTNGKWILSAIQQIN